MLIILIIGITLTMVINDILYLLINTNYFDFAYCFILLIIL